MFNSVARRLAIMNAVVVILIVIALGSVTFLALRQQLNAEVDDALHTVLSPIAERWAKGQLSPTTSGGEQEDRGEGLDEEALSSGDTIVFIVDRSGQTVYNPRGIAVQGLPVQAGIDRALAGQSDSRTVAAGESGNLRVLTIPVRNGGTVVGAAQALRSLSEHEHELALLRELTLLGLGLGFAASVPAGLFLARRAMRPIGAAFERQRAFVADASHELRTPLTLIRANTELILGEPQLRVENVEPELASIVAEVDRTDRLVDDLLILARADSGQLPLAREPHDLGAIATVAAESMQPMAAARGLQLEVEATECAVLVDGEHMLQVVRILLDNAIKHTPGGGTIFITVSCTGREATLQVRDTGEGIPPGAVEHVFDRFYRVDKARSRAAGGTGLGLAIAKALVEAQDGRITLRSQLGVGTTVDISLPLAASGKVQAEPASRNAE